MKYRGISYSIVRGSEPDFWRWSVLVGQPEMLRLGVAVTEYHAEIQIRIAIDRALDVVEALRFLALSNRKTVETSMPESDFTAEILETESSSGMSGRARFFISRS
jgi:hypothetical protein